MANCIACNGMLADGAVRTMCEFCRSYIGRRRKIHPALNEKHEKRLALNHKRCQIMKDVPRKGAIEVEPKERGKVVSIASRRRTA